jgi:competence protein ComGC
VGLGLLTLLLVVLVGSSLVVSVAVLIVVLRVSKSIRMEAQGGRERLEILREQQERLAIMHEERRLLLEELERQRAAMAEADFAHPREEPAGGSSGRPSPTPADDQVWTDGLRLLGAARDIHVERYRGAGKSFGARTTLDLAAAGERTGLPAGCDRRKAAVEWLVSDHAIEPEPALRRRGGEPIYRVTRRGFEMLAAEA